MKLKVLLPTDIFMERAIVKVVAEGYDGSFCLEPRHIDFVSALQPGLLSYETEDGTEEFLAVDEGILVKCGEEVLVSVQSAVMGPDLGKLRATVEEEFRNLDEKEKTARTAMAKLEANLLRKFMDLGKAGE